ncbi:MAG: hypothetical protein PUB17_10310 [Lachnospiraceae bacterium]|nr:hypothetical protein [Lachnospiraceae bacterium]
MEKRIISIILIIAVIAITGCGRKGTATSEHKNIYTKEELQTPYESAIEQCVGKEGEAYQAKQMRDSVVSSEKVSPFEEYSAKEWVDSEGHLKIPFDREEILKDADMTRVAYYIPDEAAHSAKTNELIDVAFDYLNSAYSMNRFDYLASTELYFLVRDSNALEEALRRDDWAEVVYNYYMDAQQPEVIGENDKEYTGRVYMANLLDIVEFLLAQPEACEQLSDEQKTLLIKKLVAEYSDKKSGKLMSGSTNGEYVKFFTWIEEGNAWYYAINDMAFTADEWKVIDSMVEWNEKE